jgi:hypothetical protein
MLKSIVAISLVFAPVKSLGFGDVHEFGLSHHERDINGIAHK